MNIKKILPEKLTMRYGCLKINLIVLYFIWENKLKSNSKLSRTAAKWVAVSGPSAPIRRHFLTEQKLTQTESRRIGHRAQPRRTF